MGDTAHLHYLRSIQAAKIDSVPRDVDSWGSKRTNKYNDTDSKHHPAKYLVSQIR